MTSDRRELHFCSRHSPLCVKLRSLTHRKGFRGYDDYTNDTECGFANFSHWVQRKELEAVAKLGDDVLELNDDEHKQRKHNVKRKQLAIISHCARVRFEIDVYCSGKIDIGHKAQWQKMLYYLIDEYGKLFVVLHSRNARLGKFMQWIKKGDRDFWFLLVHITPDEIARLITRRVKPPLINPDVLQVERDKATERRRRLYKHSRMPPVQLTLDMFTDTQTISPRSWRPNRETRARLRNTVTAAGWGGSGWGQSAGGGGSGWGQSASGGGSGWGHSAGGGGSGWGQSAV